MRPFILCTLFIVLLSACDDEKGAFRLQGRFKNMNQAELYIFDAEHGDKDTIAVNRGRFVYEKKLEDTTTFVIIFPNYSTIPVFAHSGITVEMKGDASHLKDTELKGSDENEDMTAFRLKASQQTPPEIKASAAEFISKHPASIVSMYLLKNYFLESVAPDYQEAYRLCRIMHKATPTRPSVILLLKQLKGLQAGAVGNRLPRFAVLDINHKVVTNQQLRSQVNVVCLWASWSYESRSLLSQLNKLQRQHPDKLSVMGICVDASKNESKDWMKRDTITCPIICDGQLWQSPLATAMGLTTISSNIIADKNGKILKRDIIKTYDMKKEIEKMLK